MAFQAIPMILRYRIHMGNHRHDRKLFLENHLIRQCSWHEFGRRWSFYIL